MVISLGGDGTFLKTASMIKNSNIPILGVNTDPARSVGCLCNRKIWFNERDKNIAMMFKHLERENFEFFNRQRMCFELEEQVTGAKKF